MPRPISWQHRLAQIHRLVRESARTPYTRADLEKLFKVKDAAANELLQLMPRIAQGNAHVVEREDLLAFVNGATDADDLRAYLAELRKHPPKPSRRKVRLFVPGNFVPGQLQPLSQHGIFLKRGKLEMNFTTFDDFCSMLNILIGSIEDPTFERRYCEPVPAQTQEQQIERLESARIRAENKYLVKVHAAQQAARNGDLAMAEAFRTEASATLEEVQRLAAEMGTGMDDVLTRAEAMLAELFPPSTLTEPPREQPPQSESQAAYD